MVKLHSQDRDQADLIKYHLALADIGSQTEADRLAVLCRVLNNLKCMDAIRDFTFEQDTQNPRLYHVLIRHDFVHSETYNLDISNLTKEWAACWEIHES